MMELREQLKGVNDEATFLAFVQALTVDRKNDAERWENRSIQDFLDSACAGLKIQHSALSKVSQKHHRGGNSQRFYTAESSTNNEANSSVLDR